MTIIKVKKSDFIELYKAFVEKDGETCVIESSVGAITVMKYKAYGHLDVGKEIGEGKRSSSVLEEAQERGKGVGSQGSSSKHGSSQGSSSKHVSSQGSSSKHVSSQGRIVESREQPFTVVPSVTMTGAPMSATMQKLMQSLERTGKCIYCFAMEKRIETHYLSTCPRIVQKCRKCFQKTGNAKFHQGCPCKDSIPHGINICYMCGLEAEYHAAGTFGNKLCKTWASDKLITLGIIFWTFDDLVSQLKPVPDIPRKDASGNIDYFEFFKWFFNLNGETFERNYVEFVFQCLKVLQK
jgi:hypothetical protein